MSWKFNMWNENICQQKCAWAHGGNDFPFAPNLFGASPVAQQLKNPSAMQETQKCAWSLGWEDPLKKEMAITLVFLPEKYHGQRSLAGCSSMGHRVIRDWATKHTQDLFYFSWTTSLLSWLNWTHDQCFQILSYFT